MAVDGALVSFAAALTGVTQRSPSPSVGTGSVAWLRQERLRRRLMEPLLSRNRPFHRKSRLSIWLLQLAEGSVPLVDYYLSGFLLNVAKRLHWVELFSDVFFLFLFSQDLLGTTDWHVDPSLANCMKSPLLRLCTKYVICYVQRVDWGTGILKRGRGEGNAPR